MNTSRRYSPEVRKRAVRMVLEQTKEHSSQWAAIQSIASKLGCTSETLRRWVRQTEYDQGSRVGRYLERQGLLERDTGNIFLTPEAVCASDEDPSSQLFGSSITYRIAVGPQQGRKVFA